MGITELVLATLFEQFSQGDPSVKRRYGAPGSGCRSRLAALMGGTTGRCQRGRAEQPGPGSPQRSLPCAGPPAMPSRAADYLKGMSVLTANAFVGINDGGASRRE